MMNRYIIAQFRSFSTSLTALAAGKEARVMNKLLNRSSRKRSWFPSKEISATSLPYNFQPQKGERNHRRINVLNKLFMKYVSDIMSTGEISNEIAGLRLEISKVKISSDFGTLNVYWVTKGTGIDREIENILLKNAGKMKHELTQLRVIGNVPTVQFVKDKSLSKLAEVDVLLTKADFGDDFEPTDPSLSLISEFTLTSKLPPEIQDKILSEDGVVDTEPLPPMAANVLGFDHDIVMQKILRSVNKSHASHRQMPAASFHDVDMSERDSENSGLGGTEIQAPLPGNDVSMTVQNSELKKFVSKRLALQNKMSKSYEYEKEMLSSEPNLIEDEEFDDYDLSRDSHRLKELQTELNDFDDLIENNDSCFYSRKDF